MSHPTIPDEQLDVIFHFGAYPLWKYIGEVIGVDIVEVCPRVTKEEPVLNTSSGNLVVRVVDTPHRNNIDPINNNDVIFLLNSVNVVFQSLQEGIELDERKILSPYKFELDSDQNMRLVETETAIPITNKALAIVNIK